MAALDADEAPQAFVLQAKKSESYASDNPDAYKWRVAAFAALGIAAPLVVLFILVVVFLVNAAVADEYRDGPGFWLTGLLGIALMLLIGIVGRAAWPRFGAPDGVRLKRADAPELFTFIDDVREKLDKARVNRVYVTDGMSAAVMQTPRLGYFGWYRNDLVIGLPLLLSLTKKEVAAVIAHELWHISGSNDWVSAWIYRSRNYVTRISRDFETRSRLGAGIFLQFYRRYQPFFAAYSFALARAQEYEADRRAAEEVSAQAIVDALVRVSIASDYIGSAFWEEVWNDVARQAEPPKLVYGKLGIALVSLTKWEGLAGSFRRVSDLASDYVETHPSVRDRARSLGVEPRVPPAISDAAAWLLPNDGAQLVVTFSERWQSAAAEEWSKKHAEIQSNLQRLAELDAAAGDGPLNDAEALERGFLAERFIDTEAALLRFEQALGWGGNNAAVLFQIGRILLDLGRDEGLLCLKQVIDQDDDSIVPACELAESYLAEAGRSGEAADFVRRRSAQMEILNADRADRSQIDRADKLTPHGWDDEQLEDIMRAIGIARKKGLRRAWMVQKETRHRAWEAAYFLVCDFGSYRRSDEELELLLTEMSGYLKNCGNICILLCDPNERWLPTKVSMVNNSKLFPN